MRWAGKTYSKLLSLFVDDAIYAGSILGWLVLNWALLAHLGLPGAWRGLILFFGLAAILAVGAERRSAKI